MPCGPSREPRGKDVAVIDRKQSYFLVLAAPRGAKINNELLSASAAAAAPDLRRGTAAAAAADLRRGTADARVPATDGSFLAAGGTIWRNDCNLWFSRPLRLSDGRAASAPRYRYQPRNQLRRESATNEDDIIASEHDYTLFERVTARPI